MDVSPEQVIDALLEDVKRLTLENAALRAYLASTQTEPDSTDAPE